MQSWSLFTLATQAAALYLTIPAESPINLGATTTVEELVTVTSTLFTSPTATITTPAMVLSSLMTLAPLSQNPIERRQRCFNDQGFSVNCAVWTGYYYTWGGAGHPYEGGPGDGSGSGSSGSSSFRSEASGRIGGIHSGAKVLIRSFAISLTSLCLLFVLG